jgi:hypothetical protein
VVGVDVDPPTDPAFAFAVEEATRRGATLVVVRAMSGGAPSGEQPAAGFLAEVEQRERQWLAPWQDKDLGMKIRPVLTRTQVATCPLAVVREQASERSNTLSTHPGMVVIKVFAPDEHEGGRP